MKKVKKFFKFIFTWLFDYVILIPVAIILLYLVAAPLLVSYMGYLKIRSIWD